MSPRRIAPPGGAPQRDAGVRSASQAIAAVSVSGFGFHRSRGSLTLSMALSLPPFASRLQADHARRGRRCQGVPAPGIAGRDDRTRSIGTGLGLARGVLPPLSVSPFTDRVCAGTAVHPTAKPYSRSERPASGAGGDLLARWRAADRDRPSSPILSGSASSAPSPRRSNRGRGLPGAARHLVQRLQRRGGSSVDNVYRRRRWESRPPSCSGRPRFRPDTCAGWMNAMSHSCLARPARTSM